MKPVTTIIAHERNLKKCRVAMVLVCLFLSGCAPAKPTEPTVPPTEPATATPAPTMTPVPTSTPTATPTPSMGSTMTSDKDGMVLIFVPAGEFTMGSKFYRDERPAHQVSLGGYWIDKTEVTTAMFAKYLNDVSSQVTIDPGDFLRFIRLQDNIIYNLSCPICHKWTDRITWDGTKFSVVAGYEDHPAVMVSWYGASAYCSWANRRLPTEAEWEKAARGTDARVYPWGNARPDDTLANLGSKANDTAKVGSYPAGASYYGLLDMAGNASEWVNDWYSETYYQNSPASNPAGPDTGKERVVKGNGWDDLYVDGRSSFRLLPSVPEQVGVGLGFRCAVSQ
jgi:eukaryotic-like serine/threonine-protein kinase